MGYLDDVSGGGDLSTVAHDVAMVESLGSEIGLSLNRSKCELISDSFPDILLPSFQCFKLVHPRDAVLLGAPLMDGAAMDSVLKAKCEDLQRASDRMSYIISWHVKMLGSAVLVSVGGRFATDKL